MTSVAGRPRRVFIAYAQDSQAHKDKVRDLADLLRSCGVAAEIDQYAEEERQDWNAWAHRQFTDVDYVLVVASRAMGAVGDGVAPAHRNRGVQAEMLVLREYLHKDRPRWTKKILPVVLPGETLDGLPDFVGPRSLSHYLVRDLTPDGIDALLRVITEQPKVVRPPVGQVPRLSPTRRTGSHLKAITAVFAIGVSTALALFFLNNGDDPADGDKPTVEAGAGGRSSPESTEPARISFECHEWITAAPSKPGQDRAELDPGCGCGTDDVGEANACGGNADLVMTDDGLVAGPSAHVVLLEGGKASRARCGDTMAEPVPEPDVVPRDRLDEESQLCVTTDEDNLVAVHVTEVGNASISIDFEVWSG